MAQMVEKYGQQYQEAEEKENKPTVKNRICFIRTTHIG